MSRSFASASSQFVQASGAVVTGYPFTTAGWVYPNSTGIFSTLWSSTVIGSTNNYFQLAITSSNFLRLRARDTSNNDAITGNTVTSSAWNHAVCTGTSATSRSVVLNDGTSATATGSRTPTGMDTNSFGRLSTSSPTDYCNGRLSHWAIWDVVLTAAEITMLAKGIHPLKIRPASLLGFYPLSGTFSPERDLVGNGSLTVTGATKADEPKIFGYQNL